MEVEMGGYYIRVHIVRRVLNRAEVVYRLVPRHDYHSCRVLTGGLLYLSALDQLGETV